MEGTITKQGQSFKSAWLKEAIGELEHYKTDPFTINFMNKYSLPVLPSRKVMHGLIKQNIAKSRKPPYFKDLVEYVDELKLWGKQNISLYTLKYAEKSYLKQLVNPEYIKERLRKLKLEDRYNNDVCQWESDTPFLSKVSHNFDSQNYRGWLSFKWIQTRRFNQLVGIMLRQFEERAVNFFIINLEDGSAQLRIQSLPPMPQKKLNQEIQTYKQEIEKLLDFDRFSPASYQPVMREFLFKEVLPISHWQVRTPGGNLIGARVPPNFIQRRLTLRLQGVTPLEIRAYWECDQIVGNRYKDGLFFTLDAEDNVVLFNAITDKSRVDYIISNFLTLVKLHSKHKKTSAREIVGPQEPIKSILKGGILDRIRRYFADKPQEKTQKKAAEASGLSSLVLSVVFIEIIKSWLLETAVEKFTHIPFIFFEILVCAVLVLIFYGGDRIKKYFFKISPKYATAVIKLFLGQSSEVIINSREYNKWLKWKAM